MSQHSNRRRRILSLPNAVAEEEVTGDCERSIEQHPPKASIYTGKGDHGETDLALGPRVSKHSPRVHVCGDCDELSSWLGLVRCEPIGDEISALLEQIQRRLLDLGGEIVSPAVHFGERGIGPRDIEALERTIDRCEAEIEPLNSFLLPGGCRAAAMLHVARTVCRRAERNLVAMSKADQKQLPPALLAYVNRLSDLLFVLARLANQQAGISDTLQ
jgi:cob(I)alamin adenosyltransferase